MATIELTKSQVTSLVNYATSEISGGAPQFVLPIAAGASGTFLAVYLSAGKLNPSAVLQGAAYTALHQAVKSMSYYQKDSHNTAYSQWLADMNSGNFTHIRIQPFNYYLVADGVNFTKDIPNVLAYKDSSGNWIEMS